MRWLILFAIEDTYDWCRQRRKNEQGPSMMSKVLLLYLHLLLLLGKNEVWLITMGKDTARVRLYALKVKRWWRFLPFTLLVCLEMGLWPG